MELEIKLYKPMALEDMDSTSKYFYTIVLTKVIAEEFAQSKSVL